MKVNEVLFSPAAVHYRGGPVTGGAQTRGGQQAIATVVILLLFSASVAWGQVNVFTQRFDATREGQNVSETFLTPANVNTGQFGNLYSYSVDGYVVAQPLYVANVNLPGMGVHNVIYVATMHDSVYAFDADDLVSQPLWQVSFINPPSVTTEPISNQGCPNVTQYTEVGIVGTPVIDPTTNTLYVVAKTQEISGGSTNFVFRLHALDITTGQEKFGGPVLITASAPSAKGTITMQTQRQAQRPGLLLSNGTLYIGFGSNGCDHSLGWLLAYNPTSLQQIGVLNTSPNQPAGASIWMSGTGLAADSNGYVYFVTANGRFDVNAGGLDYGDTVMKVNLGGSQGLNVVDYFTPFDQENMANNDLDLGSGGATLLPDPQPGPFPHELVVAGKTGTIYLVNRDNMGHYSSSGNNIIQTLTSAIGPEFGTAAYWNNTIYFAGRGDFVKGFPLSNGQIVTPPLQSAKGYSLFGIPVISANQETNGILWFVRNLPPPATSTTVLSALNATNLSEIYNTNQLTNRDALGPAVHFATPLIANGKVYVGTQTQLKVYGLLGITTATGGGSQIGTVGSTLPQPLKVQVVDAYAGSAMVGVPVTFSDGGKGGTFSQGTVNTDSNGNASTTYTLPKTAGAVTIAAAGPATTTATVHEQALPGAPASLGIVSGDNQSASRGTQLPAPLVVSVDDQYGNGVPRVTVTFSDQNAGGSFSTTTPVTNGSGQASVTYTLPSQPGNVQISATVNSWLVDFSETAN